MDFTTATQQFLEAYATKYCPDAEIVGLVINDGNVCDGVEILAGDEDWIMNVSDVWILREKNA